jgi:hypothetical protein
MDMKLGMKDFLGDLTGFTRAYPVRIVRMDMELGM